MRKPNIDGQFFIGTVTSTDATTYVIQVAPHGADKPQLLQGIPLTSHLSRLLGFKECFLPSIGSQVLCFQSNISTCLILGIIPDNDVSFTYPLRTQVGAGDGLADEHNRSGYVGNVTSKLTLVNNNRPTDVTAGEYVVGNEYGVLLGLFQQLAVLKGSELAQVQAFMLDDLVRIVSHNFEHFTALGDHKIFHDGKDLQIEFGLTHRPSEALGRPEVSTASESGTIQHTGTVTIDDKETFYKVDEASRTNITRIKGFVGSISRLVNLLLVRPAEGTLRALDGKEITNFDTGLASLQVGTQGNIRVATASDLALEKTNWIRVPHRIRIPEDPTGNHDPEQAEVPQFQFDQTITESGNPHLCFLQLRDYISQLYDGGALQRFKEFDKDFQINDDITKEAVLGEDTKIDPTTTCNYIRKTAGIYIMPNGGIMLRDAWGSALVMEGGNIFLQPAKDLVAQPMRNVIGKIGGNISLAAKDDIVLSSTYGGLQVKSAENIHLYSHQAGIILHSNAQGPFEPVQPDPLGPITTVGGIVLQAKNSGIYSYSTLGVNHITGNQTTNVAGIDYLSTSQLIHRASASAFFGSEQSTTVSGSQQLHLGSAGATIVYGLQGTVIGLEDQSFGIASAGPIQMAVEGILKPEAVSTYLDQINSTLGTLFVDMTPVFKTTGSMDGVIFKFQPSDYYGITLADVIPQTIVQQEDKKFRNIGLTTWVEQEVNDSFPYPGKDMRSFYATADLNNLANTNGSIHNISSEHWTVGKINDPQDVFTAYTSYGK